MLPALIGVLTGFGLVVVIPLVAILTGHQRRMAELFAVSAQKTPEIDSLRREIQDLKALVHQQTIALDSRASMVQPMPSAVTPPAQPPQEVQRA